MPLLLIDGNGTQTQTDKLPYRVAQRGICASECNASAVEDEEEVVVVVEEEAAAAAVYRRERHHLDRRTTTTAAVDTDRHRQAHTAA